jgi:hypothetical protein
MPAAFVRVITQELEFSMESENAQETRSSIHKLVSKSGIRAEFRLQNRLIAHELFLIRKEIEAMAMAMAMAMLEELKKKTFATSFAGGVPDIARCWRCEEATQTPPANSSFDINCDEN